MPKKNVRTRKVETIRDFGPANELVRDLAAGVFPIKTPATRYRVGRKNKHTIYMGEELFIGSCCSPEHAADLVHAANAGLDLHKVGDDGFFLAHLYECEACSRKPGAASLCGRCLAASRKAGPAWRGQRPQRSL